MNQDAEFGSVGHKRRAAAMSADVVQVQGRIERWRKTRKKRTAMQEQMWKAAVIRAANGSLLARLTAWFATDS
jgi:hypothetical protein